MHDSGEAHVLRQVAHTVQAHEGRLIALEHAVQQLTRELDDTASRQQVAALDDRISIKLDHLKETIEPLIKGAKWGIGIVLSAVLAAIMALVLRS